MYRLVSPSVMYHVAGKYGQSGWNLVKVALGKFPFEEFLKAAASS